MYTMYVAWPDNLEDDKIVLETAEDVADLTETYLSAGATQIDIYRGEAD